METDITKKGIMHNLCYEGGNRYNIKVERGISESGITESGITESGIT